jgi:DNA polymerase III subunit epsilon
MLPKQKLFNLVPYSDLEFPHGQIVELDVVFNDDSGVAPEDIVTALVVDCETASVEEGAGIKLGKDTVIELTMIKVLIDARRGTVLKALSVLSQLNEPTFPITDETTEITGITQGMLTGKSYNAPLTAAYVSDATYVLAHNASFDRPMIEGLTNALSHLTWVCTCKGDIDWQRHGFGSSSLEYLLFKHEFYYPAHRAAPDCFALLQLLVCQPGALHEALSNVSCELFDVHALNSPFDVKDSLKAIGFRPLYIDGKFKRWEMCNLSSSEAESVYNRLNTLYAISKDVAVRAQDKSSRYRLVEK